jgi:hypothetical protein
MLFTLALVCGEIAFELYIEGGPGRTIGYSGVAIRLNESKSSWRLSALALGMRVEQTEPSGDELSGRTGYVVGSHEGSADPIVRFEGMISVVLTVPCGGWLEEISSAVEGDAGDETFEEK